MKKREKIKAKPDCRNSTRAKQNAKRPVLEDFEIEDLPRARWSVEFSEDDQVVVKPVGKHEEDSDTDKRKKAILEAAAEFQQAYLRSGDLSDLKQLTREDLEGSLEHRSGLGLFGKGWASIGANITGEYFYHPDGRLHAFAFLVNDGLGGVPWPRVYVALHEMITSKGPQVRLNAPGVAERLSAEFEGEFHPTFGKKETRKLRAWFSTWSEETREKPYGVT